MQSTPAVALNVADYCYQLVDKTCHFRYIVHFLTFVPESHWVPSSMTFLRLRQVGQERIPSRPCPPDTRVSNSYGLDTYLGCKNNNGRHSKCNFQQGTIAYCTLDRGVSWQTFNLGECVRSVTLPTK